MCPDVNQSSYQPSPEIGKLSIRYSENRANRRTITLLLFCKGSISAQLLSANSNGTTLFLKSILLLLHFKRDCAQTSRKSWKNVLLSTSKYSRLISQKILLTSKIVRLNPDHHATKYYPSAFQLLFCYFCALYGDKYELKKIFGWPNQLELPSANSMAVSLNLTGSNF